MHGGGVDVEVPLGLAQDRTSPASSMPQPQFKVQIAHTAFKALALVTYLFSGFGSGYVVTFVMVTILSALDFWTGASIPAALAPISCGAHPSTCFPRSLCVSCRSEKRLRPAARGAAMVERDRRGGQVALAFHELRGSAHHPPHRLECLLAGPLHHTRGVGPHRHLHGVCICNRHRARDKSCSPALVLPNSVCTHARALYTCQPAPPLRRRRSPSTSCGSCSCSSR